MKRNSALDILKLVLSFMVVGIHTGFLADISIMGQYLTVNGIFRIAVPLFLLINGFYFYSVVNNGNYSYWFKKLLYLYLFWMFFYSYFWFRTSDDFLIGIVKITHQLIIGYWHLWYLSGMFGAAVLVILVKKLSLRLILAIILSTFIVGVFIQYAGNYHMFSNQTVDRFFNFDWIHRNFFFFAFPFFLIGFVINKFSLQEKIPIKLLVIMSVTGLIFLVCESYFNYINPLRDGGFDNFASLLLVCPAIFILFINLDFIGNTKQLSNYASGVYFIHIFFIYFYYEFNNINGTLLTFLVSVSSIITSYFLIKLNNKVKFIL